ncbi:MAG: hypothetical protein GY804_15295 [Alphaproteobacteria bacterium]|nr:hypothetical protein [Alphaproteobacteria bacterium]
MYENGDESQIPKKEIDVLRLLGDGIEVSGVSGVMVEYTRSVTAGLATVKNLLFKDKSPGVEELGTAVADGDLDSIKADPDVAAFINAFVAGIEVNKPSGVDGSSNDADLNALVLSKEKEPARAG